MLYLVIQYSDLAIAAFDNTEDAMVNSRLLNAGFDLEQPYETEHEDGYIRYSQQERHTRYGQFIDRLYNLRNEFISRKGSYPNMVFLGQDEMHLLMLSIGQQYGGISQYDIKEVIGLEVQETVYDQYMAVVEGLRRE